MQKTVVVLGGPNGAGKTTLARQLLLERLPDAFEFLNADFIAEGMSPFKPQKAAIRAVKEFLKRFDSKVEKDESFVVESTLEGLALAKRLSRLKTIGYVVELIYLWLPSAELAIERVANRVKRGGHSIPEEVVSRRFERSYPNFLNVYRFIANRWELLDGSETPPRSLASKEEGRVVETLMQERHPAIASLESGEVLEEEAIYGDRRTFCTSNLEPVLKSVGRFFSEPEQV